MFKDILDEILNSEKQAYSLIKYVGNAEFEAELIEFTESGFSEAIRKAFPSEKSQRLVMLGLTFIALQYYDGKLWPHVYEKYSSVYNDPKLLESKIRDNVLNSLTNKYHCARKHYQIPVINAIVPYKYAPNYIEFVNDIYVKNLDCDLTLYNVDDEIESVFNAIGGKLSDTDDSFNYSYDNDKKVYKLIRAIKTIIRTGVKKQELVLFTRDILRNLDNYYNGKDIDSSYYVRQSFQKWSESNDVGNRPYVRKKTSFIKSKFPSYRFAKQSQNIYLRTPIKRLYGEYDPKLFFMQILEDNEVIFEERNLKINFILGAIEIEQKEFKIANPLNKIRCKIYYGKEVVYDSGDTLNREYLIFDDEGKELKNNKSYNGLAYFIYKNTCDSEFEEIKTTDHYKCAYCYVNENAEYVLDNAHISLSNIRKSGIFGEKILALEIFHNDKILPIYKTVNSICLTALNANKFANKIRINDSYIDMEKGIEIVEQQNSIAYILSFDDMYLKPNIYTVELVNIQQDKTICGYSFLYDRSMNTEEVLTSDYTMGFSYEGSFPMENKAGKVYNNISLDINNINKKSLYLNIEDELFKCKINLTISHYKLDGNTWSFNHYLTADDINAQSRLFFNIENCSKVIYKADDVFKEMEIKTYDRQRYIDLSEFLNHKRSKLIELSFRSELREEQCLRIYNDIVFNQDESRYVVDSLNKEITFKTVIDGRKIGDEVYIKLLTVKGEILGHKRINETENINIFKLGDKIQKLRYRIYRKIKEMKGFKSFERVDILKEEDIAYYPLSDLIGKYLVVDEVQLDNDNKSDVKRLNLKPIKRIGDFYYIGYLYTNINGNIIPFDKVNEVLIYFSQVYSSGQTYYCDADICIYYNEDLEDDMWKDLLQYDIAKTTILNGNSRTAPYITKYRINLTQGERQYAEFKSNRKS